MGLVTLMRRGILAALIVSGVILTGVLAAVAALGLVTVERHTGFFAPVWDSEGDGIYYIERDSFGITWGFGWEHFSPPAYSYVARDDFRLRHIELDKAEPVTLGHWSESPVKGRVTRHYRGRIFNTVSARVDVTAEGASYLVDMSIPRVPTSEQWSLQGMWSEAAGAAGEWRQEWAGYTAAPDQVLVGGVEVLTAPGRESYPAAILAVSADGESQVLVRNDDFHELYPDGVPADLIAERSLRELIERGRDFRQVQSDLVARYEAEGLNEGAAILRAYRDMEELGYLPKRPRLVATAVDDVPLDTRVFEIPSDYFAVGLFQDIAAAIASPGTQVDTSTGTYLKYYDDELGPQLKQWREQGHDSFAIRTAGRTWVLTVSRGE
jgi:hypothetical protein